MGKDLPAYEKYRQAVVELVRKDDSFRDFKHTLKNDPRLKRLRESARIELANIYDTVADYFSLQHIPVFLPPKMKISKRSETQLVGGSPTEIRIYPIRGVSGVPYDKWTTQDISVCSRFEVFKLLMQEISRAIVISPNCVTDDRRSLDQAYQNVISYFKRSGYGGLVDPSDGELDHSSASTKQRIAAAWGEKEHQPDAALLRTVEEKKSGSQGCFTIIAAAVFIVVALMFIL